MQFRLELRVCGLDWFSFVENDSTPLRQFAELLFQSWILEGSCEARMSKARSTDNIAIACMCHSEAQSRNLFNCAAEGCAGEHHPPKYNIQHAMHLAQVVLRT